MKTKAEHGAPQVPADASGGTHRLVRSPRGFGRWLRMIAGVKEDILDWVPEERPRYTRLGAIVLNTGVLAGLSLLIALDTLVNVSWLLLLPAAALWAFVIVSFDGWLIASTHGVSDARRLRVFLPRLVISLLIGFVIAEPLLLWVFSPAIHKEVFDERQNELTAYESQWQSCNPASGVLVTTAGCANYRLNIKDSPQAVQEQLTTATIQRDQLKTMVDGLNGQWAELEKIARNECGGTPGPGLTGIRGNGAECKRDRQVADQYRMSSQLDKHQVDLTTLNQQLATLTGNLATAQQTAGQQISAAITEKVDAKRAAQGNIGILDEDKALGQLSDRSFFVFVAQWLVRLLLIAIDCLPVLAKMMSGTTAYDVLVSRQIEVGKRLHDKHLHLRERSDTADTDVQLQLAEYELRTRIEKINEADRTTRARRETDLDAEISKLAAKLSSQDGT